MAFLKVVVFSTLLVASFAAPGLDDHSFGQLAPVAAISHAPALSFSHAPALSLSHAPALSLSHAPALSISHAPALSISHAPAVSIAHAPVAVAHAPVHVEQHAPANYEFKYGVRDGHTHDIKEQAEKRVGDKVEGYYSLVEPDGTTRTVHYTADHHNGFNAVVQRSGHAAHPATPVKVAVPVQKAVVAPVHSVVAAPSYSYAPSFSHSAPLVSYGHSAPVLSLSHAAPSVSFSNLVSSGHGYASLGHGLSLGHGYGGYH